jgi:hypothetical protein
MGLPKERRLFGAGALLLTVLIGLAGSSGALGAPRDPFPEARPATRAQALEFLGQEVDSHDACITATIQTLRHAPFGQTPSVRRALELLQRRSPFVREQMLQGPDGLVVRYTTAVDAFDHIDTTDASRDGLPDVLQASLQGIAEARRLLVDNLELSPPAALDVLLVRLEGSVEGYLVPTVHRAGRPTLVLDGSPTRGAEGARRAAIHQYAHAVALTAHPGFPAAWGEALATWTALHIEGRPDSRTRASIDRRLAAMGEGLLGDRLDLAAGGAVWFAFLEEAYGTRAVRSTVEELANGGSVAHSLDRALRRVSTDDLAAAFREFHLWTVLVGERSDGHHFSFAPQLASPRFASAAEGLPALSIQADPSVAPLGASQVRLTPLAGRGGLRVHFEGEIVARWEADLLLLGARGTIRRLPLALSVDGRGEIIVPLDDVAETWLMIRNLGSDDGEAHRYTYSAHLEPEFPFELASVEARTLEEPFSGVLVSWETTSEQQLVGFNVLRFRENGGSPLAITPVWIPALGDLTNSTSYRFLDRTAESGVPYLYRIQGITRDGLTSLSDPFPLALLDSTPR